MSRDEKESQPRQQSEEADLGVDQLSELGFDPGANVLTRRQAQVYMLREQGAQQSAIAERLGTSRANIANIESNARENIRKARNTVVFADVLAAPVRIEIDPDTDLYEVPQRIFETCDDVGVKVNHTAAELMQKINENAGDAIKNRTVVRQISLGVDTEGNIHVANWGRPGE